MTFAARNSAKRTMNAQRKSHLALCGQTTMFGLVLVLFGQPIIGGIIMLASLALAFLEGYLEA